MVVIEMDNETERVSIFLVLLYCLMYDVLRMKLAQIIEKELECSTFLKL